MDFLHENVVQRLWSAWEFCPGSIYNNVCFVLYDVWTDHLWNYWIFGSKVCFNACIMLYLLEWVVSTQFWTFRESSGHSFWEEWGQFCCGWQKRESNELLLEWDSICTFFVLGSSYIHTGQTLIHPTFNLTYHSLHLIYCWLESKSFSQHLIFFLLSIRILGPTSAKIKFEKINSFL